MFCIHLHWTLEHFEEHLTYYIKLLLIILHAKYDIVSFQVTVHRVVNIVEKRGPIPRLEFDRGFNDDQWYGGPQNYQDARECHGEGSYPLNDRRYFDENPNFGGFRRNSSPPRNVSLEWLFYKWNSVMCYYRQRNYSTIVKSF